jgi:hypothetical protein
MGENKKMRAKVKVTENRNIQILYDETMYISSEYNILKYIRNITDNYRYKPLTSEFIKRIEVEINTLLSVARMQNYLFLDNIPENQIQGLVVLLKYEKFEEEFGSNSDVLGFEIEEKIIEYSLDNASKIQDRLERI